MVLCDLIGRCAEEPCSNAIVLLATNKSGLTDFVENDDASHLYLPGLEGQKSPSYAVARLLIQEALNS